MTFRLRSTFVAAATAALLVAPVAAEAQSNRWLPYEGHMTVHFSIDHAGMSLTRGTTSVSPRRMLRRIAFASRLS